MEKWVDTIPGESISYNISPSMQSFFTKAARGNKEDVEKA